MCCDYSLHCYSNSDSLRSNDSDQNCIFSDQMCYQMVFIYPPLLICVLARMKYLFVNSNFCDDLFQQRHTLSFELFFCSYFGHGGHGYNYILCVICLYSGHSEHFYGAMVSLTTNWSCHSFGYVISCDTGMWDFCLACEHNCRLLVWLRCICINSLTFHCLFLAPFITIFVHLLK
jgi:hypothetical protein